MAQKLPYTVMRKRDRRRQRGRQRWRRRKKRRTGKRKCIQGKGMWSCLVGGRKQKPSSSGDLKAHGKQNAKFMIIFLNQTQVLCSN